MAEGEKNVMEIFKSDFEITMLVSTEDFKRKYGKVIDREIDWLIVKEQELVSLGSFKTNQTALVVAEIKSPVKPTFNKGEWTLVLDDIRDPGNFGSILRTADWYGVRQVVVSEETADVYNPKIIHASMGSFCRVDVFPADLSNYLSACNGKIYGTYLDGADIHSINSPAGGHIIIGNESKGIHAGLEKFVTDRITIPKIGGAESLNAAIATGIVLDNLIRLQK